MINVNIGPGRAIEGWRCSGKFGSSESRNAGNRLAYVTTLRQSAGMPMPLGAGFAQTLQLLLVRATEQNPPLLPGQCDSIQSEANSQEQCTPPSAATVHGIKGPLPLLLQSFSGSKTAGDRT